MILSNTAANMKKALRPNFEFGPANFENWPPNFLKALLNNSGLSIRLNYLILIILFLTRFEDQ